MRTVQTQPRSGVMMHNRMQGVAAAYGMGIYFGASSLAEAALLLSRPCRAQSRGNVSAIRKLRFACIRLCMIMLLRSLGHFMDNPN